MLTIRAHAKVKVGPLRDYSTTAVVGWRGWRSNIRQLLTTKLDNGSSLLVWPCYDASRDSGVFDRKVRVVSITVNFSWGRPKVIRGNLSVRVI